MGGEIIRNVAILFALALATFVVPAVATGGCTFGGQINFAPLAGLGPLQVTDEANLNFDYVTVGEQNANAIGGAITGSCWPFCRPVGYGPVADNRVDIQKDQASSDVAGLNKMNVELIGVGQQNARAIGFATATNTICIKSTQV